jgi:chromosome partitioning protein
LRRRYQRDRLKWNHAKAWASIYECDPRGISGRVDGAIRMGIVPKLWGRYPFRCATVGDWVVTVVSFVSEKGGVGKTTACYHIAVALTWFHKKSVLVIDADYQRGGITGRFFPQMIESFASGSTEGQTLFQKYQQLYSASPMTPDITIFSAHDAEKGVDVIVADKRLSNVSVDKLPSTNNIKDNNLALLKHLQIIDYVIKNLKTHYDYILIDSHPELSDVLRSIIYASDYCVSPVKLDLQSAIGVPSVIAEINTVNSDALLMKNTVAPDLKYEATKFAGAIGMMAREYAQDLKQSERDELRRLRATGYVFDEYITEGDGLRRAAQDRVPVFSVSGANADKQTDQFRRLAKEFLIKCP